MPEFGAVGGATMKRFARLAASLAFVTLSCANRPPDSPALAVNRISGTVSGAFTTAVTVSLTGAKSESTTTDASGRYAFSEFPDGTYTVTPSLAGYVFSPASTAVTVIGSNIMGQDFAGTPSVATTHGISGDVTDHGSGTGLAGVVLNLSGASTASTATDSSGSYAFSGLLDGNYTVTPSLTGYTFDPASIDVPMNGGDVTGQDFTDSAVWSSVESGTMDQIWGLWASGASDVWAGGDSGTLLHWNGSAWSSVTNPLSGMTRALRGIWASGGSDVWAVGDLGNTLHWNGSAWSSVTNPLSGATNLRSAWGSGASDVWATGASGAILRWNGSAWSSVASGTTSHLMGVWGSGGSDVWAVGYSGTILHWNGSAWSSVASGTPHVLFGVWGRAASDVWAVGAAGTILHWNGSAWSSVASGTTNDLRGVWGNGESDVWAVGYSGTILLHRNGSAWSSVASGTANNLLGAGGSGASDVWVVGANGTILRRRGSP